MMSSGVYVALYSAILFFVLTPNVLLRLPPKGSTMMVAFVHALVFGIVFYFAHSLIMNLAGGGKEGYSFRNWNPTNTPRRILFTPFEHDFPKP